MSWIVYGIGVLIFALLSPLWLKKDNVTIKDCFGEILVTALLWPLFVIVSAIVGIVIIILITIVLLYKIVCYIFKI